MTILERWAAGFAVALLCSSVQAACGGTTETGPEPKAEALTVEALPPGGDFADALVVRLVTTRPAHIVYTTDGSLPSTASSPTYSEPLRFAESTLLSFVAVDRQGRRSSLVTEWYEREEPDQVNLGLPARSLRVTPDRLVFTPEPGIDSESKTVRLEAIGTEPVTVYALTRGALSATGNGYDPEAFRVLPSTTDPVIAPGEAAELRVTYFTTRTTRSMVLDIETDAENVPQGTFPLLLFGRLFP